MKTPKTPHPTTSELYAIAREHLSYDPLTGILVWIKVPPNKPELLGKPAGCIRKKDGYLNIILKQRQYLAHRLAWLMTHGTLPRLVDHKDRVRANNRLENLRPATDHQNQTNSVTRPKSDGLPRGVYSAGQRFRTRIAVNRKVIRLGTFETPAEASKVYEDARIRFFGEYAGPIAAVALVSEGSQPRRSPESVAGRASAPLAV